VCHFAIGAVGSLVPTVGYVLSNEFVEVAIGLMRRVGSRTLDEFPLSRLRIECARCGRAGSYRLDGLIERFAADAALPDVLTDLAACERHPVSIGIATTPPAVATTAWRVWPPEYRAVL
jgi:hypothetical protein